MWGLGKDYVLEGFHESPGNFPQLGSRESHMALGGPPCEVAEPLSARADL